MNLYTQTLVFVFAIYLCDARYGRGSPEDVQSDVQAPSYVPPYAKNTRYRKTGYSRYAGTKTAGRQTSYTKTGQAGTKTGYAGTKTGYAGTKTGYATKNVDGNGAYAETKSWSSGYGNGPSYQEFQNNADHPDFAEKCTPQCKNNGICVDTNTCHCPANFYGKYCEFEKKPCMSFPPLPMNSRRKCSNDFCTITCIDGHKFIDGTTAANIRCLDGQWQPTRADFTTIPDCQPECSPPCLNGGVCLSLNTCQCPEGYRGPQCQYSTAACDVRKLSFNGGYNCHGDAESFTCRLSCPAGASHSSPPADQYTCTYSTGVFQPQPIPHCVFNEVVIVTPSNDHDSYHYSSWTNSSSWSSHSQSVYGESGYNEQGYNREGYNASGYNHEGYYNQAYDMTVFGVNQTHVSSGHGQGEYEVTHNTVVIQDLTPKGGVCLTWAGVHYKTFDGKIYSFKSACQHVLVRDAIDHKYMVLVKQGDCKSKMYCPAEITVYLEDKFYVLGVGEDGSVLFKSSKRLLPIPASLPGIRVSMTADYVQVNLDAQGIAFKWDTNTLIQAEGTVAVWNKTEGLCGRLDGSPGNDMVTKEGADTQTGAVLASSWEINKVGDLCDGSPTEVKACAAQPDEEIKKALQFCTKLFSKEKFRKCSTVMDVSLLLETCKSDYCACGANSPEECACATVSVYARECLRHGVLEMRSWRDDDTCPIRCPEGKIYKSCGPEAQPSCAFPLLSSTADNSTCVEGCFCPDGLLLEGGRCTPKNECPCRLRNKVFLPGAVVPKDCNTCTCQGGEWACTQVPCGARCSAIGDPHYTTFDGLRYDFMGHCTYTLLQAENITVEVENVACSGAISEEMNLLPYKGEGRPSCTKAVNLNYGAARIHLKQGGYILVNGQEVASLPVRVGDVKIRAASSLFIIVQMPNKVDLWWDGNTRVFVDVPPEFHDKTKGLCGTFNLNQKDDFLTPEGDVEQSPHAFANKWKSRELCDDISVEEPEHPCKTHVENKQEAEKYCARLKSKLFEPCHWHVDVEPLYEACLYDMCACAADAARCLCPVLGEYATLCARSGVSVQWRYNVKECELQCAGGQEYTVCADSCVRTCADLALSRAGAGAGACRPQCVEGCACPGGQVLDANNVCVPVGMCPCFHKGLEFKPGYKEVRPGRIERELCTCVGARWDCQSASSNDIHNYPPAEDLRSNCSAINHMEFTTCEIAEPLTCKNMHLPPSTTTAECRPGCQCKKGYVLDTSSKKCVLASQCPCHHGGRSYPDGHSMKEECNTCECKSGNWSCTTLKCAGSCAAWGDSHVATFDGAEYDFEGVCTYLLAKGAMDGSDGFDVEIQNVPCGTTGATCSKSLTLKVGSGNNEEIVSLTKDAPLPDLTKLKRIKLRAAGAYVFLDVLRMGVGVQWDRGLRVYVKLDSMWRGRVKGLCGNYNGDMRDDFQKPGGGVPESSALIFADSWKLKPTCPKAQPVTDHCKQRPERKDWAATACGALKRYPFTLCHTEVPVTGYVERCERDACACDAGGDCDCRCTALAAYAQHCVSRGVGFKWRTKEICPMQCDEECSNYNECVSACPLETCDNTLDYTEIKTICENDVCVEGCKPKNSCPEGSVYTNDTFTECVPRAKCKPVCMTLADGRQVLEGEVIVEDACHTCRCSKKHKVCTGQPCSSPTQQTLIETTPMYIEEGSTSPPIVSVTSAPNDKPLACITGWTKWLSSGTPEEVNGVSVEKEPLPKINQLEIGSPMCARETMKKIECRTKVNHKTAKETGLDVECSLERGLVCKERGGLCPDFEIRVYCECEKGTTTLQPDEFQCLNSDHPNSPHPTDCTKFYECTPDPMYPDKPHKVLKTCGEGLLYNPILMVCDWPASVKDIRPECNENNAANQGVKIPPSVVEERNRCPAGQVFTCAYECDSLCDHFKKTLMDKGMCKAGEKCVEGCVAQAIANAKCEFGSRWRDERTCVPLKDCTCSHDGKIVKPNGVVTDGCVKCQCIDNSFHCDSSDCVSISIDQQGSTHLPMISIEDHRTVESVTTPPTMTTPLLVKNTATPPPECSPDHYKNLLWVDEPLPQSAFSASSTASDLFKPQYAKLNGHPHSVTAGSWNPETHNNHQYIQVEFPRREPVYGVLMQGSPLFEQFVTSYEVMYGDDGSTFSAIEGPDGKPKVFRGPVDHETPAKQMFEPPIEAKFIRIRPLTWHDEIAIRFELIGCQQVASTPRSFTPEPIQCTEPLGLAAELPIENIEVSSNNDLRPNFRLHAERGWRPAYSTPGEWIMFDFTAPRNITGIKTKGGASGWVTSYNIMYTSDLSTFNPVVDNTGGYKIFPANFDKDSVVMNEFRPPIHARYLKVLPLKWKEHVEMRVEPIGCFEPYPVTQTLPPEATAPIPTLDTCEACPGVRASRCACAGAGSARYYDGESCVSRDQCPCVEGFMSYPVGSTFRGTNCDECVCKLGGITDCKPVRECLCAPNLVPKLSKSSCECLCEPCPDGTKICPTSKLCLPLSKWCDGLQDCPDDEKDCYTESTSHNANYIVTLEPTVVPTAAPTVGVTQSSVATTTVKPTECPVVECPPGYMVRYTSGSSYTTTSDIPPPAARNSYRRYHRGGYSKGGFTKGGYSKGGYSKGGYTPLPPAANPSFTLDKPALNTTQQAKQECAQFKCIPKLPPPFKPGVTDAPMVCSTPECPKDYRLMLDNVPLAPDQCPQYVCVPPAERPVFCNVTGRTFNTFDGAEYKYDVCFHILARENRFDSWRPIALYFIRKKCRVEGCVNELMVHQDDQLILVKPNLMIEYDNYEYTVEQTSKICFQKNSFDVARIGNGLSIKSRKYNFTVLYSTDGDVKIGVPKKYMGSIDGLCGAFDGDLTNERRLPNGQIATSIDEFGRAWAKPGLPANACHTKLIPPEKQKRVWELCDVITKEPISQCGKVLNLDKWRSICLEKICECADLVINGTKRTEEECRCLLLDQIVAECLAADRNVDLSGWRIQRDCPSECPAPLVHYDCYRRRCEPSCSTIGATTHSCPIEDGQCFPGCYCPEGKLRKGDQCVLPSNCLDCSCTGAGTPAKYLTFESDDLPYLGNCTYLASRDRNETGQHKYEVYASNGPCEGSAAATCVKAVHVIYEKNIIHITKDDAGKKLVTTVGDTTVYKCPWERDWVRVSLVNGQDINLELSDAHVELTVEKSKMEFGIRVPSYLYANRTEGLCGVCAGTREHLLASSGTYTDDFDLYGKSWQATPSALETLNIPPQEQCGDMPPEPECRPPSPEHSPCYTLLNADRFGACYALIDPHPFIESCEADLCASPGSACAALERYAAECRRQGVCLTWRGELCPYTCEAPLVYRPCVDCERTCENHEELTKNPKLCDKPTFEGCFCPEGKVRVNSTCIEPTKCFPCDVNKEHYAGDEWQEDACTRCTCSKAPRDTRAHVSCTTQTCATPVCGAGEKLLTTPTKGCCPDHVCVPKPEDIRCEEPKKMECGFGQVLKTKTTSKGCKEFTCECKPSSECDRIPSENEVDILEPGMERVVDRSGCCPRVQMICRAETCPETEPCPVYHTAEVKNVTGRCCPEQRCEPPKDKCIVTLEWEAASKGGEKSRTTPQVVLKDLDSVWLDGPCRSCRCEASPLGPSARCAVTECPPLITTEQFVLEPRPVPFACCPVAVHVACRDGDNIYRVGENWTSPYDLCESYQCVEVEDGKLEKVTTVQACHDDCELALKVEIERPEVEYYDKDIYKYINASVRRQSRRSPYTVNLYLYTYKTLGDNVTISVQLLENLSGRYQPTFVKTEWKLCEFLKKEPYLGQMLAKQMPSNMTCPFKAGYLHFPSVEVTFENFNYTLPFTWPYKTISVRLDLTYSVSATKHIIAKINFYAKVNLDKSF